MNLDRDGRRYWPVRGFEKVAVLVSIDGEQVTEIVAPFGHQRMVGDFYIVGDEEGSYGVVRSIFENTHEQVAPNLWTKNQPVVAVQLTEAAEVSTLIDDHQESNVTAQAGDWLVQQTEGEIYVVADREFRQRYTSEEPTKDLD